MQTTKGFQLLPDDRETLKRWLRRSTTPSGQMRRARILFLTTERVPVEATHWSTRLMARYAGVTQRQVRRAADVKPHRLKTFKLSRDPHFAEKGIDVVGLYRGALVLSVDEKTQIQALGRTQPGLPMKPGRGGTLTHDYKRHGTTNLYAAFNVATGAVLGRLSRRHRATEFRQFLAQIDGATPADLDLHVIVDNNTATHHGRCQATLGSPSEKAFKELSVIGFGSPRGCPSPPPLAFEWIRASGRRRHWSSSPDGP